MNIVISGGTGFLGGALARDLGQAGHQVAILSRSLGSGLVRTPAGAPAGLRHVGWVPDGTVGPWSSALNGADAVVNLAGERIAGVRWTAAKKARIRDSRVLATRSLTAAFTAVATPPRVFVSGSAVGYYGSRGDESLTETSAPGEDFLALVCQEWEAEARLGERAGVRVAIIRTGLVLDRAGGVLPFMSLPFRLFAGGPTGSGRQFVAWIHLADWVGLARWAIEHDIAAGPLNGTSPNPARNADLSRAIGRALGRPSWFPTPSGLIRLALGEMGDALVLGSQRVLPAGPLALGFSFRYPDLDRALSAIFAR
jgi:uncharacterized protein (TIGR01777 family)